MKKIFWSVPAVLAVLAFASVTFARAVQTEDKIANCQVITTNVDKRITNFENQKTKHVAQYKKTQNKVVALVDKLEDEGYDVAELRVSLVTYEQLTNKFGTDYDTYITDLRGTKEYTCGRSSGEFKAKLAIAREQLKLVHDDAVAIRNYWAQTLKPAIVALKAPVVTTTPDSTVEGGSN